MRSANIEKMIPATPQNWTYLNDRDRQAEFETLIELNKTAIDPIITILLDR